MLSLPPFVGRYEIRGEIDRGNFAQVALAWDEELESLVPSVSVRTRQKISPAALEWHNGGEDSDLLYRGTLLLTALEWAMGNNDQLGPLEPAFLQASEHAMHEQQRVTEEKEQRSKRLRLSAIAMLTLLVVGTTVTSIAAYIAFRQSQQNQSRAEHTTAVAQSTELISLFDTRTAMVSARQHLAQGGPFLLGSPI